MILVRDGTRRTPPATTAVQNMCGNPGRALSPKVYDHLQQRVNPLRRGPPPVDSDRQCITHTHSGSLDLACTHGPAPRGRNTTQPATHYARGEPPARCRGEGGARPIGSGTTHTHTTHTHHTEQGSSATSRVSSLSNLPHVGLFVDFCRATHRQGSLPLPTRPVLLPSPTSSRHRSPPTPPLEAVREPDLRRIVRVGRDWAGRYKC